jgi:hypothetical protein
MALAALHDWEIKALDVTTAYLFGELEEEIYMIQPEGFVVKGQEKKVCWLMKSLYGLKQVPYDGIKHYTRVSWRWDSVVAKRTQGHTIRLSVKKSSLFSSMLMMRLLWVATKHKS